MVQPLPSAPYQRRAMTLICGALFSFCLSHTVKAVSLVSFWYKNVLVFRWFGPELMRLGIILTDAHSEIIRHPNNK